MNNKEKIDYIINKSVAKVLPDKAVYKTLEKLDSDNVFQGNKKIHIVAIGKAA